jgi:hypothetical protein
MVNSDIRIRIRVYPIRIHPYSLDSSRKVTLIYTIRSEDN